MKSVTGCVRSYFYVEAKQLKLVDKLGAYNVRE